MVEWWSNRLIQGFPPRGTPLPPGTWLRLASPSIDGPPTQLSVQRELSFWPPGTLRQMTGTVDDTGGTLAMNGHNNSIEPPWDQGDEATELAITTGTPESFGFPENPTMQQKEGLMSRA